MAERIPTTVETTPSGIEIAFYDGNGPSRYYMVNGERFTSVSTVLDMLSKQLTGWGEKMGILGCIELAKLGALPQDLKTAQEELRRRELRWWQQRDRAADRGHVSHADLVHVATTGVPPDLDDRLPEHRGYIQGVCAFVADYRPKVIRSEAMVASLEHRFAGRLDLDAEVSGGLVGFDLKSTELLHPDLDERFTSYRENFLQGELYEIGRIETGFGPTDARAIVRVDSEGKYDVTFSHATADHALGVLDGFRAIEAMEACAPLHYRFQRVLDVVQRLEEPTPAAVIGDLCDPPLSPQGVAARLRPLREKGLVVCEGTPMRYAAAKREAVPA